MKSLSLRPSAHLVDHVSRVPDLVVRRDPDLFIEPPLSHLSQDLNDLLQGPGQVAAHQEGNPETHTDKEENLVHEGRLQLRQDDGGFFAGLGGLPKVRQNRKERDQIAGEEHGNQPGPDTDPEDAGHGIDSAFGKKVREDPPLKDVFENKKGYGGGDQPGVKADEKGPEHDIPSGVNNPEDQRIKGGRGQPDGHVQSDEKIGLVQQPPPGLGLQAFGRGAILGFQVQKAPDGPLIQKGEEDGEGEAQRNENNVQATGHP